MSCDGTMIGLPLAGDRMLLVDIISTRFQLPRGSARDVHGHLVAVGRLNAAQTSGCSWMALPSISLGSNAWMPRR
jgi:hypothetical protein